MSTISKSLISDLQGDIQAYEDADKAIAEYKAKVDAAEENLSTIDTRIAERVAREVFDIGVGDIVRFDEAEDEFTRATSVTLKVTRIYNSYRQAFNTGYVVRPARISLPSIEGRLVKKDNTVGVSEKRVFINKDTKVTKIASR